MTSSSRLDAADKRRPDGRLATSLDESTPFDTPMQNGSARCQDASTASCWRGNREGEKTSKCLGRSSIRICSLFLSLDGRAYPMSSSSTAITHPPRIHRSVFFLLFVLSFSFSRFYCLFLVDGEEEEEEEEEEKTLISLVTATEHIDESHAHTQHPRLRKKSQSAFSLL